MGAPLPVLRKAPRSRLPRARAAWHRRATGRQHWLIGQLGVGLQTPLPCARKPWARAPLSLRGTGHAGPVPAGSTPRGESRYWGWSGEPSSLQRVSLQPGNSEAGSFREVCGSHPSSPESSAGEAPAPLPRKAWSMDAVPANCVHSTESEWGLGPAGADAES